MLGFVDFLTHRADRGLCPLPSQVASVVPVNTLRGNVPVEQILHRVVDGSEAVSTLSIADIFDGRYPGRPLHPFLNRPVVPSDLAFVKVCLVNPLCQFPISLTCNLSPAMFESYLQCLMSWPLGSA